MEAINTPNPHGLFTVILFERDEAMNACKKKEGGLFVK